MRWATRLPEWLDHPMDDTADALDQAAILTGPTGAGKTGLAIQLAKQIGAEIIAMDSMTVYRGMDVGTAKPTRCERAEVPHHLLDSLDPWESSSVAWWLDRARQCAAEILARGKRVLVVGGTMLYLKALLHGLFDAPPADPQLRANLEAFAQQAGPQALHARLAEVDPQTAQRIHPNNVRRVVRALEVWHLTGVPISHQQTQWSKPPRPGLCLWVDWPREQLYARIDARVEQMFAAGWPEEAARLRTLPYPLSREARQALGYAVVWDYLDGKCTRAEAIRSIQQQTRQFAKRQLTWLRSLTACQPCEPALILSMWTKKIHT